jgi:hypothetical protein
VYEVRSQQRRWEKVDGEMMDYHDIVCTACGRTGCVMEETETDENGTKYTGLVCRCGATDHELRKLRED